MTGTIEGIYLAAGPGEALYEVPEATVIANKGLEGDRYAQGRGTFSRWPGTGREVSLIEAEVIDDVLATAGIDLGGGRSRRNLVTRSVRLLTLMHKAFRVGDVVLRGDRPADPCKYLERLLGPGLMTALKGRGGLRAWVVHEGVIHRGDVIEEVIR